ncbi:MAG: NAD-dependent epimerase/dehydratase family protein [Candidatus Sumerlaeia bacterium]|nr:NAD-dependent epimerase/dehydratase family protein [Candidatus Sumerlaeia bacterium]
MQIPDRIESEAALDEALAVPYPELTDMMRRLDGDLLILGAAGKMGPSLAHLARNACCEAGVAKRIIAVSRFSDPSQRVWLEQRGVETVPCDLMDPDAVARLPQVPNVLFMVGRKFGSVGSESLTWAINTIAPANAARTFRHSRIVAFSTGCIYPLVPVASGGSRESDPPGPVGEYAASCVGRERVFEHYSEQYGTRVLLLRLNYAVDLRYGVLVDIARDVYEGRPVDLSVEAVNVIWQGDANNRALLCLEHTASPPAKLNITGAETLMVRDVALRFGRLFNKEVRWRGTPVGTMYLSNARKSLDLFGPTRVDADRLIEWVAHWVSHGGRSLGKPTHFQVTDGQYLTQDNPKGAVSP